MKCSKCGQEMINGYIRPTGNGGICWIKEKVESSAPRMDEEYIQLGDAPYLKGHCVPASVCKECKQILIDYSKEYARKELCGEKKEEFSEADVLVLKY